MAAPDWERIRSWLVPALEYTGGTHTFEDVAEGLAKGYFTLWVGLKSAVVTEIHTYPQCKALHYFLIGGDLAELLDLRPGIEAWARACGCTRITGCGRKGWERVLTDMEAQSIFMAKDLPA